MGATRTFSTTPRNGTADNENTTNGTVPTAKEKTGDFTDLSIATGTLVKIYDPATKTHSSFNAMRVERNLPKRFSAISQSLLQ